MGGLFAADLDNIELFLSLIGDRKLKATSAGVVLVPAPNRSNALAEEILASMQPFLTHAWFGAAQWPGKSPSWPYAHRPCSSWRLMTVARSKSVCECGDKTKRERIEVPWVGANHHGRPKGRKQVKL